MLVLGSGSVYAQPSLIVRLGDAAAPELHATLAEDASKAGRWGPLLEGSTRRAPVFPAVGANKSATRPAPAFVITYADSSRWRAARAGWEATPGVDYVHPNHRHRLTPVHTGAADPLADSLEHLRVIQAPEAWAVTQGASAVRVGFVDTGVWFDHPDLQGQFWANPGEDLNGNGRLDPADLNGVDDDANGWVDDVQGFDFVDHGVPGAPGDATERDPDASEDNPPFPVSGRGHGTLIAGVLAAAADNGEGITGVAPGVQLVPLRAFDADGQSEDDDLAAAIVYAAEQGIDVVNLSFGDAYLSPLLQEAIAYAHARGTIVVASGGNVGGDAPHYPSDFEGVLAVAWLTRDGTSIAPRATHGAGVDLGAPGTGVFTTLMPSPEQLAAGPTMDALYGRRSGSSLAAPQVSAAAALLRSIDPTITPSAVRGALTRSARDVGVAGWDHRTGAGLLDVAATVRQALPARVELRTPLQDGGVAGGPVALLGTVLDPFFESYTVEVAAGHGDPDGAWRTVAAPASRQVWDDTLAVWDTESFAEGPYTLRLQVALSTGRSVEVRRRLYLDRTPPALQPVAWGIGLADGRYAVVAHVVTDDLTDATLLVDAGTGWERTPSDRRARRHGLVWKPTAWGAQTVRAQVRVSNAAGAAVTLDTTFVLPSYAPDAGLLRRDRLAVPPGYLLPMTTDFDEDGLRELVLNEYGPDGWIGDTLGVYEWSGSEARRAFALEANVLPRDVGDADGDGRVELLTQVQAATLLLEQPTASDYPSMEAYLDTVGLADPADPAAVYGAQITDLDRDGVGELLTHNSRAWRVLEYDGRSFSEAAVLANETAAGPTQGDANRFEQPHVLTDDLDADGRTDVVVADSDGDAMVFEVGGTLTGRYTPTWVYETDEYSRGVRLAAGDFDGDGRRGFALFTETWDGLRSDGEYEPAFGTLRLWEATGDDAYELRGTWAFAGRSGRHGALAAIDLDGDGGDELIVAHAPDLYVLSLAGPGLPRLRYHAGPTANGAVVQSARVAIGDLDGDRQPEVIVAEAESLARYVPRTSGAAVMVPAWESAEPVAGGLRLRWYGAGLDSTTVYQGSGGESLDPLHTTPGSEWLYPTDRPGLYTFALMGWRGGQRSPLSPLRHVNAQPPTVLVEAGFVYPPAAQFRFSASLDARSAQAAFVTGEGQPLGPVVLGEGGRLATVRVPGDLPAGTILTWQKLSDVHGRLVAPEEVPIEWPSAAEPLVLASWTFEPEERPRQVLLTFNAPVDPVAALDPVRYTVRPSGTVGEIWVDAARPAVVGVEIVGRRIGPTGQPATLVVEGLRGVEGEVLPEPVAVSLVRPALTLHEAFVYPNPCRTAEHGERMVVAGLVPEATVHVLSADGQRLQTLEERNGNGGLIWDLRDASGRVVPSGVYLVRIEAPGQPSVLRKAAVIR